MISIEDIHQKIAANFAESAWDFMGYALGHGALGYIAHSVIDLMEPPQAGFLSKINPLPWAKKMSAWIGLEAATHSFRPAAAEAWRMLKPAAREFLLPIIKLFSIPALRYLVEQGYVNYVLNTAKNVGSTTAIDNTAGIDNVSLASASETIKQYVVYSLEVLKNFKPGDPKPIPEAILMSLPDASASATASIKLLERLEQYAPIAGQKVADVIEGSCHYFSQATQLPGQLIDAVTEHSGVSRPVILAGTATVGFLAYYGLKTLTASLLAPTPNVDIKITHAP